MNFCDLREIFSPLLDKINKAKPVITIVAGTNGKGETSFNLQRIALQSREKKRIALWTSPHVQSYNERFSFDGKNLDEDKLECSLQFFESLYPNNSCRLSFYELSFWLFCHQVILNKSNFIILEVGLGGRLDAVNLFDANQVILTSISRDHTEYLGSFYHQIVREKLGVLREKSKLLFSVRTKYIEKLVLQEAKKLKVQQINRIAPEGKYIDYRIRNWELAKESYESLTKEKVSIHFEEDFTSLGRGNDILIEGIKFKFYNSHNLDAHREFLQRFANQHSSVLILFFSKRPIIEIKSILKLYSRFYKNKILVGGIEDHFKILSILELKKMGICHNDFVDFSDLRLAILKLKDLGIVNYIVTGTNYIQSMIEDFKVV